MDRRSFLAVAGATAVGLAGCASASGLDREYDIGMSADRFHPATYEVDVGDAVVWGNDSRHTHTVTAYEAMIPEAAAYFASGGFDSQQAAVDAWFGKLGGGIASREVYEHTFDVAGTYHYFCIPHERAGMKGKVVVRD